MEEYTQLAQLTGHCLQVVDEEVDTDAYAAGHELMHLFWYIKAFDLHAKHLVAL